LNAGIIHLVDAVVTGVLHHGTCHVYAYCCEFSRIQAPTWTTDTPRKAIISRAAVIWQVYERKCSLALYKVLIYG